jgi:hypothetical protein
MSSAVAPLGSRRSPTDVEMLDVIVPVLVPHKKQGKTTLEATEPAVEALRRRWPGMPLKTARSKVTRLRNI